MGRPATGVLALMAIGTPANGRSSPGSIASAAASAPSASTSTNAFSLRVELLDPLERRGHDLTRTQLAAPHEGGELADASW